MYFDQTPDTSTDATAAAVAQPMAHPQSQDVYEHLLKEQQHRLDRAKKAFSVATFSFALLIIAHAGLWGWENTGAHDDGLLMLIVGLLACSSMTLATFTKPSLTKKQYYSIPGASSKEHEHICIFCGHHHEKAGFRFRNSGAWHYCSKCNKQLWYENPF